MSPPRSLFARLVLTVLGLGLFAPTARSQIAYAWGDNFYGEIGDGSGTNRSSPTRVGVLGTNVTSLSAGAGSSFAVWNGGAYAWGWNMYGQLGQGTAGGTSPTPAAITGLGSGVTAVSGGYFHSLAIQNGAAFAWGLNTYGEVGDGTTTARNSPVAVSGLGSGVTAVRAGGAGEFSLAIQNGAVYAWGSNINSFGQLGNGTFGGTSLTPAPVIGLGSGVTTISSGQHHSLAIQNGGVKAWGWNGNGTLGDGTTTNRNTPVSVASLSDLVTDVSAGSAHSLAVRDGLAYAWGLNTYGQLGDGTTTLRTTPTLVSGLPNNVVGVAAGGLASYALTADHRLFAWGNNTYGQLGNGTTTNSLTPVEVFAPSGYYFISIEADGNSQHVMALVAPVPEPGCVLLIASAAAGSVAVLRGRLRRSRIV